MRALTARREVAVPIPVVVLLSMAVLVGTIVAAGRIGAEGGVGPALLVGAVACAAVLLVVLPVHWLPAIAAVAFAALPNTMVPNDGVLRAAPAMALILATWAVRRLLLAPGDPAETDSKGSPLVVAASLFSAAFLAWALLTAGQASSAESSYGWVLSVALGAFSVMVVPVAQREAHLLKSAWVATGFVVGLYALVEVTLQRSPVLAVVYDAIGSTPDRDFGTGTAIFRADAGFGHPLWAGAYLTAAAVLGIVGWIQGGRKRDLVFGIGAAAGAVATLSRGAVSSIAIGIAASIVLVALVGTRRRWWRIAGAVVGAGFAVSIVLSFDPLISRIESAGAESSSAVRITAAEISLESARSNQWLGTGAGTSGFTGQTYSDITIESSLAQLLISLGIPGLALFVMIVTALFLNALRARDVASGMALLAYAIMISTFNAIEGVRSLHLLLGLLFLLCISPTPPTPNDRRPALRVDRLPLLHGMAR